MSLFKHFTLPGFFITTALALTSAAALSEPAKIPADSPQQLLPLGSETKCNAYSGLPENWGKNPHAGMVHVKSGSFIFGSKHGYPDERPVNDNRTQVQGFWIDQTEVTIAQFSAFVKATAYVTEAEHQGGAVVFHQPTSEELKNRPYAWWTFVKGADWRHPTGPGSNIAGHDNYPVTLVTEADAAAYAKWLGRDLPTEAEWEYAGKAGREDAHLDAAPVDAKGRPTANYWQGNFPVSNLKTDKHAGLAPVGCYAASAFHLFDMIGNAWEWTKDPYVGAHTQAHNNGDTALVATLAGYHASNQPTVIKGGSFLCAPNYCVRYRASSREAAERNLATSHIGFRTILRD